MNRRGLQRHAAAGYDWLRPRLTAEGRWKDPSAQAVDAYYKAPWGFASAGDTEAARRNLSYIERTHLQGDGDLRPIESPQLEERYPLAPHAFVAIGARLLARDDLASRLLGYLHQHRHSDLGAWGVRTDDHRPQLLDAISSSCIGLAFLENGRLEEAGAAARFLERLVGIQPQPETDFFTTVEASGVLLTDFPDVATTVSRRVTFDSRFQMWHAIAYPIMLLTRLFETEGDPNWRRLADHFVSMLDRSEQAWVDLSAGKAAWGLALLYRATGDPAYRRRALRAARGVVSWQDPDGSWLTCLDGKGGTATDPTSLGYDVCAELVLWLTAVGETLAARDGVPWTPPVHSNGTSHRDRWVRGADRFVARQLRLAPSRWRRVQRRARRTLDRAQRT